jgi:hypothetical protein
VEVAYEPGWIIVCEWSDADGTVAEMTSRNKRGDSLRM